MTPELGKEYLTRDGLHAVRIISHIGKWFQSHPVVGELYERKGKKWIPLEGLFLTYEHWTKSGSYLKDGIVSDFDLIGEPDEEDAIHRRGKTRKAPVSGKTKNTTKQDSPPATASAGGTPGDA